MDIINVPVIRVFERELPLYVGKLKVKDLLEICDIKRFSEETLEGFQRQPQDERIRQVAKYVEECPIPVMPAILVSLSKDTKFTQVNDSSFGFLEIPRRENVLTLIDGQHRLLGFKLCKKKLEELDSMGISGRYGEEKLRLHSALEYELPVLFIDANIAAELINRSGGGELKTRARPEDVELMVFYILNRTQKGIKPSLKDALQYIIWSAGIRGLPSVEELRAKMTHITLLLGRKEDSPLCGKINISGASRLGKPTQLTSFVSSLEELFINTSFKNKGILEQYEFLRTYWEAIMRLFPQAFGPAWRRYMILKAVGLYSLNMLAADVYRWCERNGVKPSLETMLELLTPLKTFDWDTIAPYSGLKGVKEAHELILKHLAKNGIMLKGVE